MTTTSANIATVPMPFIMVRRLPWPYGGKVLLPAYNGLAYVKIGKANKVKAIKESNSMGFKAELESKYGVKLSYSISGDLMEFDKIIVPADKRGQGIGTKVMKDIITWANKSDITIALTPTADFGASLPRLKKFYAGLGFKPNKGRNKDYRTQNTLIKYPS